MPLAWKLILPSQSLDDIFWWQSYTSISICMATGVRDPIPLCLFRDIVLSETFFFFFHSPMLTLPLYIGSFLLVGKCVQVVSLLYMLWYTMLYIIYYLITLPWPFTFLYQFLLFFVKFLYTGTDTYLLNLSLKSYNLSLKSYTSHTSAHSSLASTPITEAVSLIFL